MIFSFLLLHHPREISYILLYKIERYYYHYGDEVYSYPINIYFGDEGGRNMTLIIYVGGEIIKQTLKLPRVYTLLTVSIAVGDIIFKAIRTAC